MKLKSIKLDKVTSIGQEIKREKINGYIDMFTLPNKGAYLLRPLSWLKENHSLVYDRGVTSNLAINYRLILEITKKEVFQINNAKNNEIILIKRKGIEYNDEYKIQKIMED